MTGPRPRRPGAAAVPAWTGFLAASIAGLHAVGGRLAPPPLSDPAGLGPWLGSRQPVEAAFAGIRLVALGLAWYLLAATVAGVLARLSGAAALVRATDAMSLPVVRRLLHGAVGLSIVAGGAAGPAGGALAEAPATPPAASVAPMRLLPAGTAASSPPPTMRLLPGTGQAGGGGAPVAGQAQAAAGDDPAGGAPVAGQAAGHPAREWTVRPGDHLWGVAERSLAGAWGRPPTDAEVDPYWRAIVDANRPRLHDPANPDLVFPGQVLVVPPPPPPR